MKATRGTRLVPQRQRATPAYLFHMKCGKHGKSEYGQSVDLFALVTMDRQLIGYLPALHVKRTMIFRPKKFVGKYYGERTIDRNNTIRSMRSEGASYRRIGAALDIDHATVSRVCKGLEGVNVIGRYLEDCTLESALGDIAK